MSSPSYQKINYSLRLAKAIERKMFCDIFRKLTVFHKLTDYQYVGFGSTFFSDFSLFHKALSIKKMISIERERDDMVRFNFNKPYSCVKMYFDDSNDALPNINLTKPTILWLDYDTHLTSSSLIDLSTFFAHAESGSFFIITVNAHADTYEKKSEDPITAEEVRQFREEKIIERVGEDKLPRGLSNSDFSHKKFPDIYYDIIINEITDKLTSRNLILDDDEAYSFRQVCNFSYQDGAKMLTIGGVLIKNKDSNNYSAANFPELEFFRGDKDNRFNIDIPSLTYREIRYLDSLLPNHIKDDGTFKQNRTNKAAIPEEDIVKYMLLYKYFPTFAEAIV